VSGYSKAGKNWGGRLGGGFKFIKLNIIASLVTGLAFFIEIGYSGWVGIMASAFV